MAPKSLPPVEYLRQCLSYDSETGDFVWLEKVGNSEWNNRWAGRSALSHINRMGYKTGSIASKQVKAHRVAWAFVNGAWPNGEIDHINGIRSDNRIDNLREATKAQNAMNRSQTGGRSRYKGVYPSGYGAWCAQIQKGGKRVYLGTFETEQEAASVYDAAAGEAFGSYAKVNSPI